MRGDLSEINNFGKRDSRRIALKNEADRVKSRRHSAAKQE
jgi:hypothetical protein